MKRNFHPTESYQNNNKTECPKREFPLGHSAQKNILKFKISLEW
jgi:hypothetical protein